MTATSTLKTTPVRVVSQEASSVLEAIAEHHKRSIRLPEDSIWLGELSSNYLRLLSRMNDYKLLYRVERGRYVVAPRATDSLAQAASMEMLVDLVFSSQGDYFLSHLSALIAHRLTDLHSSTAFVSVKSDSNLRGATPRIPGYHLKIHRFSASRWPQHFPGDEVEKCRIFSDTKEFVWRSSIERTLVDGLMRPDLCAGIETVIGCWAAALQREINWASVCAIAKNFGLSATRRTAFLLHTLKLDEVVTEHLADLNTGGKAIPLISENWFNVSRSDMKRDSQTGVLVNIPEDYLRGWILGADII
jgi:predicted transcriptional regulator of viral defense system